MNEDELKSLLRDAEHGIEIAETQTDELAARVRRLDRRRSRWARAALATAPLAALVGAVALWWWLPGVGSERIDERTATVSIDWQEIERLQAEADYQEQLARAIVAGIERDRAVEEARRVLAQPDPLDEVREQIDVVAYRMIQRADALRAEMELPEAAIRIYREIERMFPTTYSAELARTRLHDLGASQGET